MNVEHESAEQRSHGILLAEITTSRRQKLAALPHGL